MPAMVAAGLKMEITDSIEFTVVIETVPAIAYSTASS